MVQSGRLYQVLVSLPSLHVSSVTFNTHANVQHFLVPLTSRSSSSLDLIQVIVIVLEETFLDAAWRQLYNSLTAVLLASSM